MPLPKCNKGLTSIEILQQLTHYCTKGDDVLEKDGAISDKFSKQFFNNSK